MYRLWKEPKASVWRSPDGMELAKEPERLVNFSSPFSLLLLLLY